MLSRQTGSGWKNAKEYINAIKPITNLIQPPKIAYFPDLYEDEIFHSAVARYFDRMGYPNISRVLYEMVGISYVVSMPFVHKYITSFCNNILKGCHHLPKNEIINDHTIIPLLSLCNPDNNYHYHNVIIRNTGNQRDTIKMYLCSQCIIDDRNQYGECYWHRSHQIYDLGICQFHRIPLLVTSCKGRGYYSAERALQLFTFRTLNLDKKWVQHVCELANDFNWILKHRTEIEDHFPLLEACRDLAGIKQYGNICIGHINYKEIYSLLFKTYSIMDLKMINCNFNTNNSSNWVRRILRQNKRDIAIHPIQYILLMRLFGKSPKEFFQYKKREYPFGKGPYPCINPVCKKYRKMIIDELIIRRRYNGSERLLVGEFNCPLCGLTYFKSWSVNKEENIIKENIKRHGKLWEKSLKLLWRKNRSPGLISKILKADYSTIIKSVQRLRLNNHRRTGRGFYRYRYHPRHGITHGKLYYRAIWLNVIKQNPTENVTQLTERIPRIGHWLYRRDNKWYGLHPKRKYGEKRRINWQIIDHQLEKIIQDKITCEKHSTSCPHRMRLSFFFPKVGQNI